MRIFYLLILFLLPIVLFGQFIDFESPTNEVEIDTTPDNLWQIGVPNKTFLDNARSPLNAIITDTINNYPANNSSSFVVTPDLNYRGNYWLEFYYKIDTEAGVDGGYVELSIDEGTTWMPLYNGSQNLYGGFEFIEVYNLYEATDTLFNGQAGVSGQKDWTRASINIVCLGVKQAILVQYKFTFISNDSISGEGWMIDDFQETQFPCYGSSEDLNKIDSKIYPNPVTTKGIIELDLEKPIQNGLLQIYNTTGLLVAEQPFYNSSTVDLDVQNLINGIYFYQLDTEDQGIVTGRFMVNGRE